MFVAVVATQPVSAQTTIRLYAEVAPGSQSWSLPEQSITSPFPGITVVANVSEPTLTVFRPNPGTANGTAVIVVPGGGFHFLAVDHEGAKVAEWLTARGVTAFVLKYRVHKQRKRTRTRCLRKPEAAGGRAGGSVFPLSVADAKRAVSYVRERAGEFGVDANRVGMIGFSAGAMIALAVAVSSEEREGPDFVAPLYLSIQDTCGPSLFQQPPCPSFSPWPLTISLALHLRAPRSTTRGSRSAVLRSYISTRRADTDSACANKACRSIRGPQGLRIGCGFRDCCSHDRNDGALARPWPQLL